jgi:hypothetical protein
MAQDGCLRLFIFVPVFYCNCTSSFKSLRNQRHLWLLQAQEHTYIFLSQPFKVVHSLWNLVVLQIAQRNGVELDVDLALGFASHYCKIGTMECLVDDGNAEAFLGPLMRAAERGCMEVSR